MQSEQLQSSCGPSRLAHQGDLCLSQRSKSQKFDRFPLEWITKSLFQYFYGRCYLEQT